MPQDACERIVELVMSGELRDGDRLPNERELAGHLQIGRSSLREGIRRLEVLGLLRARPGVGTFVQALTLQSVFEFKQSTARLLRPTWKELSSIIAVRRFIEPELAGRATQCTDVRRRNKLTWNLPGAYREDPERFLHCEVEFNVAIAEMSGNPVYPLLLRLILDLYLRSDFALQTVRYPELIERTYNHLSNIHERIRRREPERARAAVGDYLDYHQGLVLGVSREQPGTNGHRRLDTPRQRRIR